MNDETNDKVNLFSGDQNDSRTMHAHPEPPALSFQPGATFSPGSSAALTQVSGVQSVPHESESKVTAKLDDIIAKSDDAPIRSTSRTGDAILDEIKTSELGRTLADKPAMDIVKKPLTDDNKSPDSPTPLASLSADTKIAEKNSDSLPIRSDDDLKDELEKTYSADRDGTKQDMPVKPEATDKPLIHDDSDESKVPVEEGAKAVRLKNVNVASGVVAPDAAKSESKQGFPNENHLAGTSTIANGDHQPAPIEKAKPASKKGLKYAIIAVAATLVIGVGGAMAYTPARTQIAALITGKKAAPVSTNTPQPSPTTQTEQNSDTSYSVNDYLQGLSGQNNSSDSSAGSGFDFKNKASYAQNSSQATTSKKLTTNNIPTSVSPPTVGSLFPAIPPSQVVNDYIGLESPCFETVLPKDNQPFYNDWCIFGANYGAQFVSNLQIIPYAAADKTNFENVINYFKSNLDPTIKLSSESTISVGGISARKLVFTGSSGAQSFPDIMVMVDFGKDRYTKDAATAHGFLIAGSYNDDFSKKSFDTTLEHWNWN